MIGSLFSYLTLKEENYFLINLSRLLSITWECEFEWDLIFLFAAILIFWLEPVFSYFANKYRFLEIEKEFFLAYNLCSFYF